MSRSQRRAAVIRRAIAAGLLCAGFGTGALAPAAADSGVDGRGPARATMTGPAVAARRPHRTRTPVPAPRRGAAFARCRPLRRPGTRNGIHHTTGGATSSGRTGRSRRPCPSPATANAPIFYPGLRRRRRSPFWALRRPRTHRTRRRPRRRPLRIRPLHRSPPPGSPGPRPSAEPNPYPRCRWPCRKFPPHRRRMPGSRKSLPPCRIRHEPDFPAFRRQTWARSQRWPCPAWPESPH